MFIRGKRIRLSVFAGLMFLAAPTHSEATLNDCGQPSNTGMGPTASSALYVLRASVGTLACSPCLCDVDWNGTSTPFISATDALRVLQYAVGLPVTLNCPPGDQCVTCDNSNAVTNAINIAKAVTDA